MGLDTVELFMEVDDTFKIEIPDSDVGELRTVGQIVECVWSRGPRQPFDGSRGERVVPMVRSEVEEIVRRLVSHHLGVRIET